VSRCQFTPQASKDLEQIADYIARDNPRAAARFIENIEQKCQFLADFPGSGTGSDDLAPQLRSFAVGNYVIYYRPVADRIEIIRVLHGARDISKFFRP
jgi:toxin ParE1/3/4